jgi:hypothetical protein
MTGTTALTGRVLTLLLRHQLATTDQLRELLEDPAARTQDIDDRLEVLHQQGLTARHLGAWHLSEDGIALACAQPENAGLRPDRPPRGRTTLALTGLGIAFRRQHRADFTDAPFDWQTQVRHRFRDSRGHSADLEVDARVRTCWRSPAGMLARDALVMMWSDDASLQQITQWLLTLATFVSQEATGGIGSGSAWQRWYPRVPHVLLVTESRRPGVARLMDHLAMAVSNSSICVDLLPGVRVGVTSRDDIDRRGAAAASWLSPAHGGRHAWTQLP